MTKQAIVFYITALDVEHASILASQGFSKPAVILAGSVIVEFGMIFQKGNIQ